MAEPIAYLRGQFIPATQLVVEPQDMGFMLGVTVSEQLRTFGGEIFSWTPHFDRLTHSLNALGIVGLLQPQSFHEAVERVTQHNFQRIPPTSDLGVTIFVTPGIYPSYAPHADSCPTVAVHTYPLPFVLWADKYELGERCVISTVRQVSPSCWPRHLKCRSCAHYFLADRQARDLDPRARAILLDEQDDVNEATTANVIAYFAATGLVSPPLDSILPGVSLQVVAELASQLEIPFTYRRLHVDELRSADEILLTSTPFCILPVSSIDGRELGIGPIFAALLSAWSDRVGINIVDQARGCK